MRITGITCLWASFRCQSSRTKDKTSVEVIYFFNDGFIKELSAALWRMWASYAVLPLFGVVVPVPLDSPEGVPLTRCG